MTIKTLSLCNIITAFLSLITAEKCDTNNEMLSQTLVPVGQPLAVNCLLEKNLNFKSGDYNLTWYKVGNQTPVPRDKLSRIHQQKSLIWFLPAMLEDSGDYECVIRNLTSCSKIHTKVTVFERVDGLCLNENFAVEEIIFTLSSGKVVCPHLDYFRDEKNTLPVHWYKDCQILEGRRFFTLNSDLFIFNVTLYDRGNYTCKTSYMHNGKQYNISRDIKLSVVVSPPKTPPEISHPRNNSIEVQIGSQITLDCNATGAAEYDVFWTRNDTYIDVLYVNRIFEKPYEEEISHDGRPVLTVKLIILEVCHEDYEQPFVCHASNAFGKVASYITLKHRVLDLRRWLIGGLISLLVITVITLIIYKTFKIDFVLWYRNSGCVFVNKEVALERQKRNVVECASEEVVKKLLQQAKYILNVSGPLGLGIFPADPRVLHLAPLLANSFPHCGKKDGKIYDAYVLYPKGNESSSSYPLETFVLRVLPDVLERQCGYNLFILGRDDLPGEAVISVAHEILKQSRRLMIILQSEASSCCMLEDGSEQQLTVYNALIRDEIKVILIEMDKIQDCASMPESIRYIKQKHGAIQWKGDFSEKSCSAYTKFWKNVRYQMPHRKKTVSF